MQQHTHIPYPPVLPNESDDIYKISFACSVTDKAESFIKYVRDIVNVFLSNENTEMIIKELTENGKILPSYSYYETQWYSCSAHSDENGFYFEYGCEYQKIKINDFKEVK